MFRQFTAILSFSLIVSFGLRADPAPSWASQFWQNMDVSDLRSGCIQRAQLLLQNAKDVSLSPEVPAEVAKTLKMLVIFPYHGIAGLEMWWRGIRWAFHAVVTFEQDGERYVLDAGEPHVIYTYVDWLNEITKSRVAVHEVAIANDPHVKIGCDNMGHPRCLVDAQGRFIAPMHPVLLLPDEPEETQTQNSPGREFLTTFAPRALLLSVLIVGASWWLSV